MGGGGGAPAPTRLAGIQIQTSTYGLPLPIVYGTNRIAANLIWYGNFQSSPNRTSAGKGGSQVTSYNYSASVMLALCEGQIGGIGNVWDGQNKTTLSALGFSEFDGVSGQAAWSWLTGYVSGAGTPTYENILGYGGVPTFSQFALGYSEVAYVAAANYSLGTGGTVPNHNFEIKGFKIFGSGIVDANPADVITDFMTNAEYGVTGFSSGYLGSLTDISNYCVANGYFISPALTTQRKAADYLNEWCNALNIGIVWSEGILKFIPYGDTNASGNGATFTANTTPLFDLTDDDFIINAGEEPVQFERAMQADAYNAIQLNYMDRASQYNTEVAAASDQMAVDTYGLRFSPTVQADFICDATVAKNLAQLMLQQIIYIRNTYTFKLGQMYIGLEPMDLVTLTDSRLGLNETPVRITDISEDASMVLTVTAEDFTLGVASPTLYPHDSGQRYLTSINAAPSSVATPQIFEVPASHTSTGLALVAAVGGQTTDPLYGGCSVWMSSDGTNYKKVGRIQGQSRYGTLTASFPAGSAGVDNTHTLSLELTSNGTMTSGTAADMTNGATLLAVGQEFMSYQTVTLTGTNAYNISPVNRGLYGSTAGAHASGTAWARLDETIFWSEDFDHSLIGKTVYFKFTAFNLWGAAEQDLSTATAYPYAVSGYAVGDVAIKTVAYIQNQGALATQSTADFATQVSGAQKPADYADVTSAQAGIWSTTYLVSASTAAALTGPQGGAFPTEVTGTSGAPAKIVCTAVTTGTDTKSQTIGVFTWSGTAWSYEQQYILNGTISNVPILYLDGNGTPSVKLYSNGDRYYVQVTSQLLTASINTVTDSIVQNAVNNATTVSASAATLSSGTGFYDVIASTSNAIVGAAGSKVNVRLDATIEAQNGYNISATLKQRVTGVTSLSWVSSGYTVDGATSSSQSFYVSGNVSGTFSAGQEIEIGGTAVTISSVLYPAFTGGWPPSIDYTRTLIFITTSQSFANGAAINTVGGAAGGGAGDGYVQIQTWPNFFVNSSFSGTLYQTMTALFDDEPGPGTFDYKITFGCSLQTGGSVANQKLSIWETKK